ncbi:alcohol dehydrogenase catalytic domain-containing protein [Saccharothrix violaceirubra]|uniref:2-desacetyl-2-hydroxyethyl bacteriochlorophyllide A dehydrogenase n=1 Tax=Saccharothrix violaceirubra TaxID=413306 RepID=A0A7W7T678_9PSEU|nr:alcohol dehydrogenase catalytic domain-containing protein [Saccharothrix violaceirubra]MBB4967319.1 2-desacetyl-2-hydroxyethyl bacteriochlorophyllide A dehydrogenase [Saccharothrix violaceirubra]
MTDPWPRGTMPAVLLTAPGRVERGEVPIPDPVPGEVLVRTRYVGLCGTDLELLHGKATYVRDGRTTFPHVPGHEWWGEVVAADTGFVPGDAVVGHTMVTCGTCARCAVGRRQQCLRMAEVGLYGRAGAAAEYVRVPAHALTRLPGALTVPSAVLVEPAVTVVEALTRAGCRAGERVAVVGTGTIGLLAVQLAAWREAQVVAVGVDPAGLALARRCGAAEAVGVAEAPGRSFDLVVEASGGIDAFGTAVRLTEDGGRIAVVGVSGAAEPVVAGDLVLRGITVYGIQHGLDHYTETVALFAGGVFDGGPLVAAVLPAYDPGRAFDLLEHGRTGPPKVILGAQW